MFLLGFFNFWFKAIFNLWGSNITALVWGFSRKHETYPNNDKKRNENITKAISIWDTKSSMALDNKHLETFVDVTCTQHSKI